VPPSGTRPIHCTRCAAKSRPIRCRRKKFPPTVASRGCAWFDHALCGCYYQGAGWSSPVARWAHNPKVAGSNPAPATNNGYDSKRLPFFNEWKLFCLIFSASAAAFAIESPDFCLGAHRVPQRKQA
jgi:hypothetical protein